MSSAQVGEIKAGVPVLCWDERCKKSFLWTPKQDSDVPPSYHSRSCQNLARRSRQRREKSWCPAPDKWQYDSAEEAGRVQGRMLKKGTRVKVYHCQCGKFHLGKTNYIVKEDVA